MFLFLIYLLSTVVNSHKFNGTMTTIAIPNTKNGMPKPPNCLEINVKIHSFKNWKTRSLVLQKSIHTEYKIPPKAGPVLMPRPTKVSKIPCK